MAHVPPGLLAAENMLRIAVLALPFFAPLERGTKVQAVGGIVFGVGTALYFISWLPLILAPTSPWSTSTIGFLVPAVTPGGWLLGLALLIQRLHWPSPFRWWHYLALSTAFLGAHISHVAIGYARTGAYGELARVSGQRVPRAIILG